MSLVGAGWCDVGRNNGRRLSGTIMFRVNVF
jgi:hypothetical protein